MLELGVRSANFDLSARSNYVIQFSIRNPGAHTSLNYIEVERYERDRTTYGRVLNRARSRLDYKLAGCVRIHDCKLVIIR